MDVFKYFNQSLAADELSLVSLPLPNDPPSRLSSWAVPPTCKFMDEMTHCQGKCLWQSSSLEQRLAVDFRGGRVLAEARILLSEDWNISSMIHWAALRLHIELKVTKPQIGYWFSLEAHLQFSDEQWPCLLSLMLAMAEGALFVLGWAVIEVMEKTDEDFGKFYSDMWILPQVSTWGHRQGSCLNSRSSCNV